MKPAILFLDHAPIIGGAEKSLLMIMRGLRDAGWEIHLAAPAGPYAEQVRVEGITVHPLLFPRLRRSLQAPGQLIRTAAQLQRIRNQTGVQLVYANTVRTAFYGAAAIFAGLPFIWHMRDFSLSENPGQSGRGDRLGKQFLCRSARLALANSRAVGATLPCAEKVRVVHNGIDPAYFDPAYDAGPFRLAHAIPEDAPVVGMVGRLRPWKGQARFLRAVAGLAAQNPAPYFLVAGGPSPDIQDSYEAGLHAIARQPPLAGRVVFTGHLEDVRPAFAAMNVFVHPGDPEPFGLVNLEAMAMGKPVVAFAHGALPEIVVDGQTGLLSPPGDEAGLADAVRKLLEDPGQAQEMGKAGMKRVQESFSQQRMVGEVRGAIEEVLG